MSVADSFDLDNVLTSSAGISTSISSAMSANNSAKLNFYKALELGQIVLKMMKMTQADDEDDSSSCGELTSYFLRVRLHKSSFIHLISHPDT